MNIVNLIHIGDEVKNLDTMSQEERKEIARALNRQALEAIGYRKVDSVKSKEETA